MYMPRTVIALYQKKFAIFPIEWRDKEAALCFLRSTACKKAIAQGVEFFIYPDDADKLSELRNIPQSVFLEKK